MLSGAACRWIRTAPERAAGGGVTLLEAVPGRYWPHTEERCKINQIGGGHMPSLAVQLSASKPGLPRASGRRISREDVRPDVGRHARLCLPVSWGWVHCHLEAKRGGHCLRVTSDWRSGDRENSCGDKHIPARMWAGYADGRGFIRFLATNQITLSRQNLRRHESKRQQPASKSQNDVRNIQVGVRTGRLA